MIDLVGHLDWWLHVLCHVHHMVQTGLISFISTLSWVDRESLIAFDGHERVHLFHAPGTGAEITVYSPGSWYQWLQCDREWLCNLDYSRKVSIGNYLIIHIKLFRPCKLHVHVCYPSAMPSLMQFQSLLSDTVYDMHFVWFSMWHGFFSPRVSESRPTYESGIWRRVVRNPSHMENHTKCIFSHTFTL